MRYLKEVVASRELLMNLTMREIRGKYRRTIFGQLWSLANPLALMLIYTVVFGFILRIEPGKGDPSGLDSFALWLLCGLLPWTFFATVLSQGVGSLVGNQNLIQKVYFPRILLPLSLVGSSVYNWLFEMVVLLIALTILGSFVLPWLPLLLVIMMLLAVFATGIALLVSVANVFFRDTQYFLSIILQIWFFLTPVIYPVSLVKTTSDSAGGLLGTPVIFIDIYQLNPLVHFVEVFRNLLYDNRWPETADWVWCMGASAVSISLGLLVFRRNERLLAESL